VCVLLPMPTDPRVETNRPAIRIGRDVDVKKTHDPPTRKLTWRRKSKRSRVVRGRFQPREANSRRNRVRDFEAARAR